ncbi:MAG: 1-phosphofructokinase family hexose kinase, partial [Chloroflexi bacterium]|nr:1-phosphofructokinase family hexose kinase [Chloroflexota bacterium]
DTNRVQHSRIDPGGKGINVSRVLQELGRESMASGLAPGSLGRFVEHSLLERGILCDFVHTRGQTRTNLTVVDESIHETTLLSYRGPEIDPRHMITLETKLRRYLSSGDWLVVAGSIPPPIEPEAYERLIELGRDAGVSTVLDADAEALAAGLRGKPDLVKTNHHEAERLLGRELGDDKLLEEAAHEMRAAGAGTAVITAGGRGAVAVTEDEVWWAWPPEVAVVSSVGAGDALLAGMLLQLSDGRGIEDALRWGTAAGAAACLTPGTQLCAREAVLTTIDNVRVKRTSVRSPAPTK